MPIAQPAVKWVRIRRGQSNPVLAGKSRPKRQRAAPKGARKFRASARCSLRYGRVEPKQAHKAACRGLGSTAKPSWTGGHVATSPASMRALSLRSRERASCMQPWANTHKVAPTRDGTFGSRHGRPWGKTIPNATAAQGQGASADGTVGRARSALRLRPTPTFPHTSPSAQLLALAGLKRALRSPPALPALAPGPLGCPSAGIV